MRWQCLGLAPHGFMRTGTLRSDVQSLFGNASLDRHPIHMHPGYG